MIYGMFLILKITKLGSILEEYRHYILVFRDLLDAHNISKSSSGPKVSSCAGVYRLEHNYIVRYIKISQLHVSALTAIFRLDTRLD